VCGLINLSISRQTSKKKTNKVFFMYAPEYKEGGSTVMRSFQLAEIMKRHYGNQYLVKNVSSATPIIFAPRRGVCICVKMAIIDSTSQYLKALKTRGNIIVFDPVDAIVPDEKMEIADGILASSLEGYDFYKRKYPRKRVFLVNHHVDPRITPVEQAGLSIGYFGELGNTIITEAIKNKVDFVSVDTSSQNNLDWLNALSGCSAHYAIRKRQDFDGFKPATKVFTAARCNAIVIIQDSEKEAVRWLGLDYPYLIHGDVTEKIF
jgi:hypothetical protein